LGLAGAIALAGCSSGQVAETASLVAAIPGVDANVGDIAIRDAAVSFPPTGHDWPSGSDVPLQLRLVNTGSKADQLLSVSADLSSSVGLEVVPEGGQATTSPEPLPSVATGTPSPSISGQPSPPPSRGTAPGVVEESPSEGTSASASNTLPLQLPAGQIVALAAGGPQLVLKSTTEAITASTVVKVTLRFAQAGSTTLELPFSAPESPLPRVSLSGESEPGTE
jgi:copper(I)-binding protein